jgi:hypothetical protein
MAGRQMVETGAGMIPEPLAIQTQQGKLTEQAAAALSGYLATFATKINGNISLGDGVQSSRAGNLDAQWLSHFFLTADAEEQLPHDLKRVPVGYWVVGQDKAGSVYVSNKGGWGNDRFFLKASASGITVAMIVF